MKTTCVRAAWRGVWISITAVLFLSCASGPEKKEPIMTVDEFERNSPEPADPCTQRGGEPLECETNGDCCKGMLCTKDPSRSHVKRYCLDG